MTYYWLDVLNDHGELHVMTDAGAKYHLHKEYEIEQDGDGRDILTFEDGNGEEHGFYADAVENWWTHRSARMD